MESKSLTPLFNNTLFFVILLVKLNVVLDSTATFNVIPLAVFFGLVFAIKLCMSPKHMDLLRHKHCGVFCGL